MKKIWLILALLLCPTTSLACGCFQLDPNQTIAQALKEARKSADAIFSGKVVEVVREPRGSAGYNVVRFEVEESWKGVNADGVSLASPLTSCAFPFKAGERYLVYAYRSNQGELDTSVCSRTRKLEGAETDTKLLGSARLRRGKGWDRFRTKPNKSLNRTRNQAASYH